MAKKENAGYTVYTITPTTNGSGAATSYSDDTIWGEIVSISYVKVDYTDGVDFTITGENTGVSLWTDTNINATETVYPRVVGNLNTDGSALTTHTNIVLAGERLKIVIAQGGASHSGTFTCIVRGR